ncbi:UDP-forming cellulose synthase catalytic subunit [Parapusillimonas granuli]|uniref:Cellulose synthase catalytic subunit [UDP-forming] n=1 Tax=Parapusillimonas granuli TaxID=380911 RepID=A0A853FQG1_9BURK|nr:UDP-forming cellulose synthase catalytic subunit [Parapusillimonas granuli]MBB5216318.1 cellulose synthase (UDP-forming) [Parapusillimonas granuli]MEB2401677.1 UDP-forming cellulose synthase catalytic subunit [Alcaligenaceae bacterium]NYT47995.1 UDP-forming cellulose synthase catalytic subunit [Parapusillimonas granuli]
MEKPANRFSEWLAGLSLWDYRPVRILTLLLSALLFIAVVTTPLDLGFQVLFALTSFALAMAIGRLSEGRLATLVMVVISVVASLRYMYWRITTTLGFETWLDMAFGYGLLLAEIYALLVLLFSYFQSAWPLQRKPALMPPDIQSWPSVDIYIPTYNEPLSVVRQTIFAALSQDWPADKLNVYVLDDGRREEFRAFCASVGVGYLTRPGNRHAKAGNINAALPRTQGEYIAVFDCDHVPTRSFLQVCVGWFLKDGKLAMLQTPHVFFSPDPLEKNLGVYGKVPNEGRLFYGLTQDGNDLWNATFFCGSCAVIRREPLMEVGGMAVESVTEDALTALKMNRAGYNTAYLAIPLAAGLATENLSRHIGQRIRWARGMAQIFRRHNPFFGKGLTLSQRICYASAALHFFYGLPRLVFLTAPLAYLYFGAHVFQASALMIAAYVLPHIVHAYVTGSRIQGKFRHSFWNEVYESVLAWYIARPTLATLIAPDSATFNVTAKGGTIQESYFDWRLSRPYIILLVLNLAGLAVGAWQVAHNMNDSDIVFTALINMAWTLHNVVICSASVAVAGERRQIRSSPRVGASLTATLHLPGGYGVACQTSDFSQDGLGISLPTALPVQVGDRLQVSIFRDTVEAIFPVTVVFVSDQRLGLHFTELTLAQQVELSQMTFARADIWTDPWNEGEPDTPLAAAAQLTHVAVRGVKLLLRESLWALVGGRRRPAPKAQEAAP